MGANRRLYPTQCSNWAILKLAMTNWNSREPHHFTKTDSFWPLPVRKSDGCGIPVVSTHGIVCDQVSWFVGRNPSRELNAAFGRCAKLERVLFWKELPWEFRGCSVWSGIVIPHTEMAIDEYCSDPIFRPIGCHYIMSSIDRNSSGQFFSTCDCKCQISLIWSHIQGCWYDQHPKAKTKSGVTRISTIQGKGVLTHPSDLNN